MMESRGESEEGEKLHALRVVFRTCGSSETCFKILLVRLWRVVPCLQRQRQHCPCMAVIGLHETGCITRRTMTDVIMPCVRYHHHQRRASNSSEKQKASLGPTRLLCGIWFFLRRYGSGTINEANSPVQCYYVCLLALPVR